MKCFVFVRLCVGEVVRETENSHPALRRSNLCTDVGGAHAYVERREVQEEGGRRVDPANVGQNAA